MGDSLHKGHRKRLRERFLREGLDGFDAHTVLEMLLFAVNAQRDTNQIAHRLINCFGSLSAVFDAPYEDLLKVEGVGEAAATLIKLVPELSRRYLSDRGESKMLGTAEQIGEYLLSRFVGRKNETVFLLCLDAKGKVLFAQPLFEGTANVTQLNIRKVTEIALKYNAVEVIIAHNHPGGIAHYRRSRM